MTSASWRHYKIEAKQNFLSRTEKMKLDVFFIGTTIGAQKCPEDIIKRLFKIFLCLFIWDFKKDVRI